MHRSNSVVKSPAVLLALCLLVLPAVVPVSHAQTGEPDINAPYRQPGLEVDVWVNRFEVEGREVFDYRNEIAAAAGIRSGQDIADIGAGTGLFVPLFSRYTGPEGTVYAVDIVPGFIEHIRGKAGEKGLHNVEAVLGEERSINLPENSVDIAFVCDAYHHFEYYEAMLDSIKTALRPGGELFIVEFDKIPGQSDQWILDHIRGTKEEFTREIEANGFRFVEEIDLDGLQHTFIRRFREI